MLKRFLLLVFALTAGLMAYGQDVKTYIPAQAHALIPTVRDEATRLMPELDTPWYFAGLIEHESCISLKHSRCWNSKSQLKSEREFGLGLGQITKAFNPDGSIRFDALKEMKSANPRELKDLEWETLRDRPDLQIRTLILQTRGNFYAFSGMKILEQRMKTTDTAYNRGRTGVTRERAACGLAADCDPQYWDNNIERYCLASKKPLYAGRSACDISRHHSKDIWQNRMPKYKPYFLPVKKP